jgi:hypothetical protein
MGLNAYFTYQVVGIKGSGSISFRLALMAVFLEGWIFVILALTGMRHWLVKIIPSSIKIASGVGIGLFLTLIGMSYSSGVGIITGASSTPLAIGGCPAEDLSATGECSRDILTNPKARYPRSTIFENPSDMSTADVGWYHLWWNLHSFSHGIPCQVSYCNWHHHCFHLVVAVSMESKFSRSGANTSVQSNHSDDIFPQHSRRKHEIRVFQTSRLLPPHQAHTWTATMEPWWGLRPVCNRIVHIPVCGHYRLHRHTVLDGPLLR